KEELVKQQQVETKKLAELNKKKIAEKEIADKQKSAQAQAAKEHAEQEKIALAHAEEKKKQAAAQAAAAQSAERQVRIAGEVNKYKALILNSISRNWILPENVNQGLSSQFRIHLAPNGTVLSVTLLRSSGDSLLDRSAQTAIYKAS